MATPGRSAWSVSVRDRDKREVASAAGFVELGMTLKHNDVSSWKLTVRGDHPARDALLADGAGIVVRPEGVGEVLLSGPRSEPATVTESRTESRIVVEGVSDEIVLKDVVYPTSILDVSTSGLTKFATIHNTDGPTPAETAILNVIGAHIGSDASVARRGYSWLHVPASLGRGSTVTRKDRFNTILESAQRSATLGGLNFRLVQTGQGQVSVVVSEPQYRPRARFSVAAGNLTSAVLTLRPPTVDEVIVMGAGEGTDRVFTRRMGASQTPWGHRSVKVLDQRHSADLQEMRDAADEELVEGAAQAGITLHPKETAALRFGVHYRLGDVVTASVGGRDVQDVVRQVVISEVHRDNESSSLVVPSIGEPEPSESSALVKVVRAMFRSSYGQTRG